MGSVPKAHTPYGFPDAKDARGSVRLKRQREDIATAKANLERDRAAFEHSQSETSFMRLSPDARADRIAKANAQFAQHEVAIKRAQEDLANDPDATEAARAKLAEDEKKDQEARSPSVYLTKPGRQVAGRAAAIPQ